ncbi:hypothetical protein Droror1_Dr00003476 [Drosera rotundifolia]
MTVSQYAEQFGNLSRFAPDLVDDEEVHCRRFEAGLHPGIRRLVVPHRLYVFEDLLETTRAVELDWETTQKDRQCRKAKGVRTSEDSRLPKRHKSSSPDSDPQTLRRSGSVGSSRGPRRPASRGSIKCYICDQTWHGVSQCPQLSLARASVSRNRPQQPRGGCSGKSGRGPTVCYRCQQPGHISRDCPNRSGTSQVASTGQTSTQQSRPTQPAQGT